MRGYFMITLLHFNCLRASNLMNISLETVFEIKKHDETDDVLVPTNPNYKISLIYGPKIIIIDCILSEQYKVFSEFFRK